MLPHIREKSMETQHTLFKKTLLQTTYKLVKIHKKIVNINLGILVQTANQEVNWWKIQFKQQIVELIKNWIKALIRKGLTYENNIIHVIILEFLFKHYENRYLFYILFISISINWYRISYKNFPKLLSNVNETRVLAETSTLFIM